MNNIELYPELQSTVNRLSDINILGERKKVLQVLIDYVVDMVQKIEDTQAVELNFICTHNSRRSHLAMVWAQTAADINDVNIKSHSWWTEATAFFHRSVSALQESWFQIEKDAWSGAENPVYLVKAFEDKDALRCFSKTFDHDESPRENFGAVMVCDNADTNCPVVLWWKKIPVKYVDPKEADKDESLDENGKIAHYKERSDQIGSEMLYVFSEVKKVLSEV